MKRTIIVCIVLLVSIIVPTLSASAQDEGDVIYLPAGPHFTLKNEIKSIVTVTAKTWHYWIEHVTYRELPNSAKTETNEVATLLA